MCPDGSTRTPNLLSSPSRISQTFFRALRASTRRWVSRLAGMVSSPFSLLHRGQESAMLRASEQWISREKTALFQLFRTVGAFHGCARLHPPPSQQHMGPVCQESSGPSTATTSSGTRQNHPNHANFFHGCSLPRGCNCQFQRPAIHYQTCPAGASIPSPTTQRHSPPTARCKRGRREWHISSGLRAWCRGHRT